MSFSLRVKDCDSNNPISGASVGETGDYTTNSQGELIFSDCDDLSACAGDSGLTVSGLTTIPASGAAVNTALFSVSSFGVKGNTAISIATSGWSTSQVSLERATVRPSSTTIYNSVAIPDNLSSSQITYTLTATTTGNVSATGSVVQEASEYVLHWNEEGSTGTTLSVPTDFATKEITLHFVSLHNGSGVTPQSTLPSTVERVAISSTSITVKIPSNYSQSSNNYLIKLKIAGTSLEIQANIIQDYKPAQDVMLHFETNPGRYPNISVTASTFADVDQTIGIASVELDITVTEMSLAILQNEPCYIRIRWENGPTDGEFSDDFNTYTLENRDDQEMSISNNATGLTLILGRS